MPMKRHAHGAALLSLLCSVLIIAPACGRSGAGTTNLFPSDQPPNLRADSAAGATSDTSESNSSTSGQVDGLTETGNACAAFSCPSGTGCDLMLGPPQAVGEDAQFGYQVNAATGNLFLNRRDFVVSPAIGLPLSFERNYNSQNFGLDVGFGGGWTHTYSWQVVGVSGLSVKIIEDTGRVIYFSWNGSSWASQQGEFGVLMGGQTGPFVFTNKFGTAFSFTALPQGRLTSVQPSSAKLPTQVTYDANNHISAVTEGASALAFTFTGNHITKITTPAGAQYQYTVTAAALTVTYPNFDAAGTHGKTVYGYADTTVGGHLYSGNGIPGQMTTIAETQSATVSVQRAMFGYTKVGATDSQITALASGFDGTSALRYTTIAYSLCASGTSSAVATLNGGNRTAVSTWYGGQARLTSVTGSANNCADGYFGPTYEQWQAATYSWNSLNLTLASIRDGVGNVSQFGNYDAKGNPQQIVEAVSTPSQRTFNIIYNSASSPVDVKAAGVDGVPGHVRETIYDFDADYDNNWNQNPTKQVHQIVEIGYTDTGLSGTLANQVIYTTQLHYNSNNQLTISSGPTTGQSTTYDYYLPDAGSNANLPFHVTMATSATANLTLTYLGYDLDGRPLSYVAPDGSTNTTTYDLSGNPVNLSTTDGTATVSAAYVRNSAGQVTTITAPNGQTSTTNYDKSGRPWRGYASTSDQVPVVEWSAISDFDTQSQPLTYRVFSGLKADPGAGCQFGGTEQFCRDRVYSTTCRTQTDRTLDSNDQLCSGLDCTMAYQYDANGNLSSVTEAGLNEYVYGRDPLNRVNSIMLPTGFVSTLTYDLNDDVITRVDPRDARNNGTGGNARTNTYLYDDFKRLVKVSSPDTGKLITNYDANNHSTAELDAVGNTIHFTYDFYGRPLTRSSSTAADNVSFTYDETGSVGGAWGASKGEPSFAHSVSRLTTVSANLPAGATIKTHYSYDLAGRSFFQSQEVGVAGASSFYDITEALDSTGLPSSIKYPDGYSVTYTNGQSWAPMATPSEVDVSYMGVTTPVAKNVAYFADGIISGLTYGNGSKRNITRNKRGEWTRLTAGPVGAPNIDQTYTYDTHGFGDLAQIDNFLGKSNNYKATVAYDPLHRIASYSTNVRPQADSFAWSYDEVGNRLSQTYNGVAVNYIYDAAKNTSQLASLSDGSMFFTYYADGRTKTVNNAVTYGWDTRGSLASESSVATGLTTSSYQYDGLLRRYLAQDVASGHWTRFIYDTAGQLLEEYTWGGAMSNGNPEYIVTDHVYLGEGAGEVGRVVRYYVCAGGSPTTCTWQYSDQDLQYVETDIRHAPMAIESAATGALAWEAEINPFGVVINQGLPGTDGKIGTADDLAATTSNTLGTPTRIQGFAQPSSATLGSLTGVDACSYLEQYGTTSRQIALAGGVGQRTLVHGSEAPDFGRLMSVYGPSVYAANGSTAMPFLNRNMSSGTADLGLGIPGNVNASPPPANQGGSPPPPRTQIGGPSTTGHAGVVGVTSSSGSSFGAQLFFGLRAKGDPNAGIGLAVFPLGIFDIWSDIGNFFSGIANAIWGAFTSVADWIAGAATDIAKAIGQAVSWVISFGITNLTAVVAGIAFVAGIVLIATGILAPIGAGILGIESANLLTSAIAIGEVASSAVGFAYVAQYYWGPGLKSFSEWLDQQNQTLNPTFPPGP